MNDKNSNLSHKDSEELLITSTSSSITTNETSAVAENISRLVEEGTLDETEFKTDIDGSSQQSNEEICQPIVNVDININSQSPTCHSSGKVDEENNDCLLTKEEETKIPTHGNISLNEETVTPSSSTMGGASSNNDSETCVLPKNSNYYIERINENTKNLNCTRPSSISASSVNIVNSVSNVSNVTATAISTTTMSAPTTRSKRKLISDGETSTVVTVTTTGLAAQPSRNNSISVHKLIKLDVKDIKENVKNHQIQPQVSMTTRRSAAAAAAAATSTAVTTAASTLSTSPLKTKTSINSIMGKKSDGNLMRNDDSRSIIIMRSGSSGRKHLADKDKDEDGEEIEESHTDDDKDIRSDITYKIIPIANNTITKSSETKDGNNSNSNSSKNPANSSCDIDDKQLNAGEIRKVEPLIINLNRDAVIKPTKITIKPIIKPTLYGIEKEIKETNPPTSPIPKLTIKSTSSNLSTIVMPAASVASSSNDSGEELNYVESHPSVMQGHSEPHILPKLTIRTSDCSNSLANSDITHSVVPKLTIKMDCAPNCTKEISSSTTSSSSTSSPSPPPLPLPKLTIKTSGDMSEATILSSCSPQKPSSSTVSSNVCKIVGTSTMTSSLSSSQTSVPKLTIKTVQISSAASTSCDTPTIPKLTIKSIPLLTESEDSVRTDEESLSETDSSPCQQTQGTIPKLTIRTSGQEPSIKIHQCESSSNNSVVNQSIPKLTIRTKSEQVISSMESNEKLSSVPKFTIRSVQETTQSIPKLTISVSDSMPAISSSLSPSPEKIPKLTVRQIESNETEGIPKYLISVQDKEEANEKVPKITIKGIQEMDSMERIPKLTIKPVQEPIEETEKVPKLTIKPIVELENVEKIPKITIKTIQEPEDTEKTPNFKVTVSQSDPDNHEKVPKLTIKQIQETVDVEKVPKLTIRTVTSSEDCYKMPKLKIKPIQEIEPMVERCPKLTIKGLNELDNLEKIPKLLVKKHESGENLEKIPKLTIKQIQDNEDGRSTKLTVVQNSLLSRHAERDSFSDESDFLGESSPKNSSEEEREEEDIANTENTQKKDGNVLKKNDILYKTRSVIETITLTKEDEEMSKTKAEKEIRLIENCIEGGRRNELEKVNTEISRENQNVENIELKEKIFPEIESIPVEHSSESHNQTDVDTSENTASTSSCIETDFKDGDGDGETKMLQNVEIPRNVPVDSSDCISLDSKDEGVNEGASSSQNSLNDSEKGVSFCSSMKDEDVVEALLAVLQQYQDGGNNSQVPTQNFLRSDGSSKITNSALIASRNFDSVADASSDDDVVIVGSDCNLKNPTKQIKKSFASEKLDDIVDEQKHNHSKENLGIFNESSTSGGEMYGSAAPFQNMETVDLTLSPRSQPDGGYQGTSLLGRLLSRPLQNDIMSKCINIASTSNEMWLNENINESEKRNLKPDSFYGNLNRSESDSRTTISSEKKNSPPAASSTNSYEMMDEMQHSPATSLENLLNNMNDNSLDDIRYISRKRAEEKDVLEALENLEALQSAETLKMLEEAEETSKIIEMSRNSQELSESMRHVSNFVSNLEKNKSLGVSENFASIHEKGVECISENNNEGLTLTQTMRVDSKSLHRSFKNSLKRPLEESDSSDCVEISINKKPHYEMVDIANNTLPDSISLDSEPESMAPSSDCSLNQTPKETQSNLTENETSSMTSGEHFQTLNEVRTIEGSTDGSVKTKVKNETTVDLKVLLSQMNRSNMDNVEANADDANSEVSTPEKIRPEIAVIQEGPVRHRSRKSKHILINDHEESGSDRLANITNPLATFANSIYDKKNHEIDSGVDVSGSLQMEGNYIHRQPLKRPRGRPRKDGLPAGSVKKLPRSMNTAAQSFQEGGEMPVIKRKYRRKILATSESPTSTTGVSTVVPSDPLGLMTIGTSKEIIPVTSPTAESIPKRSDTPSALSSCSVPSPTVPHLTPEIPTNSSENTSPTQPSSSSSSFPTITLTPKSPSKRGNRGGRNTRGGRGRGGIVRSRPRCIGGLSHTPEIAKEGQFFTPQTKSTAPQVFEEDTRMSAESISAPAPTLISAPIPLSRQSETVNNEDTQSSILSSTSILEGTPSCSGSVSMTKKKSKSKMEVIAPEGKTEYTVDMIAEYDWPPPKGCCPAKNRDTFMIQEQIAQYLGIKSFKRKYPDLPRRQVDMEERNWLQEKGLVTEKMCDLGITAVWASDVLDIMYSDFYDKYEEYKTYIRQKHLRDIEAKQKASASVVVDRTMQARDRALHSAAKWNSNFNKVRKEDRRLCLDLQNLVINVPAAVDKKLSRPLEAQSKPPSNYPVALVPGQFVEHYREYTSEELRKYPLNTILDLPASIVERIRPPVELDDKSDSESESSDSSSSESESDSSSDESDSDSDSSSDEDDRPDSLKCFVCHQPQIRNLHGLPELFVRCYTCRRRTHPSCIEMPHRMVTRIRNYNWQCAECKCCIKCKKKVDESKMVYCEQCDRGYHIYCVRIKSVPEGRWHCEHCTICMRCGTNKPEGNVPLPSPPRYSKWKPKKKWFHEYRVDPLTKLREHISIMCAPCARLKRNSKPPS